MDFMLKLNCFTPYAYKIACVFSHLLIYPVYYLCRMEKVLAILEGTNFQKILLLLLSTLLNVLFCRSQKNPVTDNFHLITTTETKGKWLLSKMTCDCPHDWFTQQLQSRHSQLQSLKNHGGH